MLHWQHRKHGGGVEHNSSYKVSWNSFHIIDVGNFENPATRNDVDIFYWSQHQDLQASSFRTSSMRQSHIDLCLVCLRVSSHNLNLKPNWYNLFRFMCRRMLLLNDELPTDHTRRHDGDSIMSNLVFTNYTTQASSHLTHNLYLMKETQGEHLGWKLWKEAKKQVWHKVPIENIP